MTSTGQVLLLIALGTRCAKNHWMSRRRTSRREPSHDTAWPMGSKRSLETTPLFSRERALKLATISSRLTRMVFAAEVMYSELPA